MYMTTPSNTTADGGIDLASQLVQDWETHLLTVPRQDLEIAADRFSARGFAVVPFLSTSAL